MKKSTLIKTLVIVFLTVLTLFIPFDSLGVNINPVEQRVVAMFVLAALSWILEPYPIWATSILIIVLMIFSISDKAPAFLIHESPDVLFSNLLSYKAVMATFADPTIMLFLGGFFLAASATKYQLDMNIARVMLKPFGKNPKYVLLGLMMITAIFSMFMSNTATAAMMLAILAPVLAIFEKEDKGRIAFALAIPIGANIGGMGTPIGTPPNAIAVKALSEMGLPVSFAQWMTFAVPYMILVILLAWVVLIKLFPISKKEMTLEIKTKFQKTPQAIVVYITFAATVLLWMTGDLFHLNSNAIAMIPMAVFALTRVITKDDLNGMAWDVLWLVAGGFALGLGIQKTGLAEHLLAAIPFGQWPVFAVLIGAALIGIFMSTFMSNTASASLLMPIMAALGVTLGSGLDILGGTIGLLVTIALACSLAMSLPISTPPNALAYSTGYVKTKDMAKVGVIMGVVGLAVAVGMMLLLGKMNYFTNPETPAKASTVVEQPAAPAVTEQAPAAVAVEQVPAAVSEQESTAEAPASTVDSAAAPAATPAPSADTASVVESENKANP